MKKLPILIALLTILSFILTYAYAVDPTTLEWKLPAKYRLIYQVDLNGVTDTNVYIDLNIPSYVYDHLVQRLQAGQLCGVVENNRLPDELWPVAFYASDSNTTQRYVPNYSIVSYYTYTTACTDVNGVPYVAKFPETIRIHIPALDGNIDTFNTFNHYILLYEPFLFLDTMNLAYTRYFGAFGWIGAPMIGNELGDLPVLFAEKRVFYPPALKKLVFYNLNLPLNASSQVFLKASYATDFWTSGSVGLIFSTNEGKNVAIVLYKSGEGINYICIPFDEYNSIYYYVEPRPTYFFDVLYLFTQTSKIPVNAIASLKAIGYCAYSEGSYDIARIDDVMLIVT